MGCNLNQKGIKHVWKPIGNMSIANESGSTGFKSDNEKRGELRDLTYWYISRGRISHQKYNSM